MKRIRSVLSFVSSNFMLRDMNSYGLGCLCVQCGVNVAQEIIYYLSKSLHVIDTQLLCLPYKTLKIHKRQTVGLTQI